MHKARPYGLHVIGKALTDKDEAFISNAAARLTNLKETSKVKSLKMVYDLPDGGYVIIQDAGGNFRVIAHKPIESPRLEYHGLATNYVPMLFSGIVTKSVVRLREGVGLSITEMTRRRLVNYDLAKNTLPAKQLELHRFRIDYHYRLQEFKPRLPSEILRTQYTQLRATWYSGAMSEVVQIVSSFGKQATDDLPDDPTERAQVVLPSDVVDAINLELGSLRLPAYSGLPDAKGEVGFDYKFNHTNAVGFDESNKPWLLRIDASGVWAMPLPIIPATTTNAFRLYMTKVGDDEILAILDRFGGIPSGESFPIGNSFQSWRRAGVVIKVCDTSDFYSHIAYSSACGWSLNSRGTEGYNTCYDYYDDEGLGYGLTYKLTLRLASSQEHLGERVKEFDKTSSIGQIVDKYLAGLIPTIGRSNDDLAILYKLRRVDTAFIYARALGRFGKDDRLYWHNLELPPIANHQGKVSEVYRGYLYHPAKFQFQPQIKFPEPLLGGCVSHDFLPLINGRYKDKYPNSDTIMFAYYVSDSLKVVKYFVDWGTFERQEQGNFEPIMQVGSWWQESYSGKSGIQGYFYSTDIDDRETVSPSTTYTTIKGEDKGYDSKPFFSFDHFFAMCGTLWRNRYYTHETQVTTQTGKTIDVAVCVPYLCRNTVIQAKKDTVAKEQKSESLALKSVRDPTSYSYWTYDFVMAWNGMRISNPKGVPYPKNGNPVWVEERHYNPSPFNDFANNGDWISALPADYTWLVHPKQNEWQHSGGGGAPTVQEYYRSSPYSNTTKGELKLSAIDYPNLISTDVPANGYYLGSPNEFGDVFYRDACKICFGESEYYNVSEPNKKYSRAWWGYSKLPDHKSAHCFIGVINE